MLRPSLGKGLGHGHKAPLGQMQGEIPNLCLPGHNPRLDAPRCLVCIMTLHKYRDFFGHEPSNPNGYSTVVQGSKVYWNPCLPGHFLVWGQETWVTC